LGGQREASGAGKGSGGRRPASVPQGGGFLGFPDLSSIPAGSLRTHLRPAWPDDAAPDSLQFELVRLGEKALWDYNAARAHYVAWVEGGQIENAMGCADRLEDCINATDRGLRCLKDVLKRPTRRSPELDGALRNELGSHKAKRRELRRVRAELYAPRNPPEAETRARLSFDHTQVAAATRALTYRDLGFLVRTLHTLIREVIATEA
jgi:hypothetical protein